MKEARDYTDVMRKYFSITAILLGVVCTVVLNWYIYVPTKHSWVTLLTAAALQIGLATYFYKKSDHGMHIAMKLFYLFMAGATFMSAVEMLSLIFVE